MKPVLIIAEAGVNHNGDINVAKQLIDAAAEACVDVVKFQTYKTENIVSKEAKQAAYQNKNIDTKSDTQYEMLKKLELPIFWHTELHKYASDKVLFFYQQVLILKVWISSQHFRLHSSKYHLVK